MSITNTKKQIEGEQNKITLLNIILLMQPQT